MNNAVCNEPLVAFTREIIPEDLSFYHHLFNNPKVRTVSRDLVTHHHATQPTKGKHPLSADVFNGSNMSLIIELNKTEF